MPTRSSACIAPRFSSHGEIVKRSPEERHPAEQPEADVGEDRQSRHKIELLEDHAHANAQFLGAADDSAVALDRLTEHGNRPAASRRRGNPVDRHEAGERANKSRFAGAGCTDEGHISHRATEKVTSSSTRVPRSNDFDTRRTSITA
jgi:hypothetical protein